MSSLDVKRFYIEGITLREQCPTCGNICTVSMANTYLSYPSFNNPTKPETIPFNCEVGDCYGEEPFEVDYVLEIKLTKAEHFNNLSPCTESSEYEGQVCQCIDCNHIDGVCIGHESGSGCAACDGPVTDCDLTDYE